MSYKRIIFFGLFLVFQSQGKPILGHENERVHFAYTQKSINLFPSKYPEFIQFTESIKNGSRDEDPVTTDILLNSPLGRPMTHFYNPFNPALKLLGQHTAYEYAPQHLWDKALFLYTHGSKNEAYVMLGRAAHIIQDMTSPPHVHSDPHLSIPGLDEKIFQSDTYEYWEDSNWFALNLLTGSNPRPGVLNYKNFIHEIALETNKDTRIQGNLSRTNPVVTGDFATLFPDTRRFTVTIVGPEGDPITAEFWEDPSAGTGVNYTGPEGSVSFFDLDEDWWITPSESGQKYIYLENVASARPKKYFDSDSGSYLTNSQGYNLAQLWEGIPNNSNPSLLQSNFRATDDQTGHIIPRTVEAVAGLLRYFAESVDKLPPSVILRKAGGTEIYPSGTKTTNETSVRVEATDPSNLQYLAASGIYRVVLTQTSGGTFSSTQTFIGMQAGIGPHNLAPFNFNGLTSGNFNITTYDGLGNMSSANFSVDQTRPRLLTYFPQGADVPLNARIIVSVDEALDPASIDNNSIVVTDGPTAIPGAVQYIDERNINFDWNNDGDKTDYFLIFFPNANTLPAGKTLNVTLSLAIKDAAGNIIDYTGPPLPAGLWSFTTIIPPPSIEHVLVSAAPDSLDLSIQAKITPYVGSLDIPQVFYRFPSEGSVTYTPLTMQDIGSNVFRVVITAPNIKYTQGLEYFIYAKDSGNRIGTLPAIAGLSNPNQYLGGSNKLTVFKEPLNPTIVVGDDTTSNDLLPLNFYLNQSEGNISGNRLDLTIFRSNRDFTIHNLAFAADSVQNITSGVAGGVYSYTYNGRQLQPGNYVYYISEINSTGNIIRTIVPERRLRSVRPLTGVSMSISHTTGEPNDLLVVTATETSKPLSGAAAFQSKDLYQVISQTVAATTFNITVPHSDFGHDVAVYTSMFGNDQLIGLTGIPKSNPSNAPEVIINNLGTQTNGHPIRVSANISDLQVNGQLGSIVPGSVILNYKTSGGSNFTPLNMNLNTNGNYTADIPSQPSGVIIQFYVVAQDTHNFIGSDPPFEPALTPYSFNVVQDMVPPSVTSIYPSHNQTDLPLDVSIKVFFSEALDETTVNLQNITLAEQATGIAVSLSSFSFDQNLNAIYLPPLDLKPNTIYTVTLKKQIRDLSGNEMLANYSSNFKTSEKIPPIITILSFAPTNYAMSLSTMNFLCTFSEPVSTISLVLTNMSLGSEFFIPSASGTNIIHPSTYAFAWDGMHQGSYLPDGEYSFRIEGTSQKYNLTGASDNQPFNWKVKAEATVIPTFVEDFATPNFPQYVVTSVTEDNIALIATGHNDVTDLEGTQQFFLNENQTLLFIKTGEINPFCWDGPTVAAQFKRMYVNPSETINENFYLIPNYKNGTQFLKNGEAFETSIFVQLVASNTYTNSITKTCFDKYDHKVTYPNSISPVGVNYTNIHPVAPFSGNYDDNPNIDSYIEWTAASEGALSGTFRAINPLPRVQSFLIDRTSPTLSIAISKPMFSAVLNQSNNITYTAIDNLYYGLKDVAFKIYDSSNSLIRSFLDVQESSQSVWNFQWDGKNLAGQLVADGTYYFKGTAEDYVGNPATFSKAIVVDNMPPQLTGLSMGVVPGNINHPNVFNSQDSTITLSMTLSDNLSDNLSVEWSFRKSTSELTNVIFATYPVTTAGAPYGNSFNWKDPQGNDLPDGTYLVDVTAYDRAGNSTKINLPDLRVDRTPSVVISQYLDRSIFSPDDGSSQQGDGVDDTATLTYQLSEPGFVTIDIRNILGISLLSIPDPTLKQAGTYAWNGKINGDYVNDGTYIFRVRTKDDVDNESVASVGVIKNKIPAQLMYPALSQSPVHVTGNIIIKGVAVDPYVNDLVAFDQYQLWFRQGENHDFTLAENNPANPDTSSGKWQKIPVTAANQDVSDSDYPNANTSVRSVLNSVLGIWDTSSLTAGDRYTLLLVSKDKGTKLSYARQAVEIDQAIDNTAPVINLTNPIQSTPDAQFNITSSTSALSISYTLQQDSGKASDVSIEIFQMTGQDAYGPIQFRKDYFNQTVPVNISWDGRNSVTREVVPSGPYKVRATAKDTDGMGVSFSDANISVNESLAEPLQIKRFDNSSSIVAPNQLSLITYRLSKEAVVTISVNDFNGNQLSVLVSSVTTPGLSDRMVNFSNAAQGLYIIKIHATSTDNNATQDSASLSIAVTNGGQGGGTASISEPAEGAVIQGEANFNWVASATGKHYPPQSFNSILRASGQEIITQIDSLTWNRNVPQLNSEGIPNDLIVSGNPPAYRIASVANQGQMSSNSKTKVIMSWSTDSYPYQTAFQSFFTPKTAKLGKVQFFIDSGKYNTNCTNISISLWSDNLGLPQGQSPFANKSIGCLNDYTGVIEADFSDQNIYLPAGTFHWASVKFSYPSQCGDVHDQLRCQLREPSVYGTTYDSYGTGLANTNDGSWHFPWGNETGNPRIFDFAFNVIMVPPQTGSYSSTVIDGNLPISAWNSLQPIQQLNGQTITYKTQTSNTGNPNDWDSEVTVDSANGWKIGSETKRYLKWRAYFNTSIPGTSPALESVAVNYINTTYPRTTFTPIDKSFSGTVWYLHPMTLGDSQDGLLSFFASELAGKTLPPEYPDYSVLTAGNPNVSHQFTIADDSRSRLISSYEFQQNWSSLLDTSLANGKIIKKNVPFNNDSNPLNFALEGPYNFTQQRIEPITISSGYPNVNMAGPAGSVNQYMFWNGSQGNIDNPYVAIDASAGEWDIELQYPDGTPNPSLRVKQDLLKASNFNRDPQGTPLDVDDDFTVMIASGSVPKSFIEIRGNTSGNAQGFSGYSLFYRKSGDTVFKSIPAASTVPVSNNGILAYWNVSGLNGPNELKLVVVDNSGITEIMRNVTVGVTVPGQTAGNTLTYVRGPFNKAYIEFPDDSLAISTVVSITPVNPYDEGILISTNLPQPVGAFYKMQPSGIQFLMNSTGTVARPAQLTAKFLPYELDGVDPGELTLYSVRDNGTLDPLDARVTFDTNGNGTLDTNEIVTVQSPITHFSYFLAIEEIQPPVLSLQDAQTSQNQLVVSGAAEANSIVDIFVNDSLAGTGEASQSGLFQVSIQLVPGLNKIYATATRELSDTLRRTSKSSTVLQINNGNTFAIPRISTPVTSSIISTSTPFFGFGLPNSIAKLYINGLFSSSTIVGSSGQFQIMPTTPLAPGHQILTVTNINSQNGSTLFSDAHHVYIDAYPPVTQLIVSSPNIIFTSSVTISTFSLVSFSAVDTAIIGSTSGIKNTFYMIDGGTFSIFTSSFNMSPGTHNVQYRSIDNAGNTELLKSIQVKVDDQAPAAVAVTAMPIFNSNNVSLSWIAPGDDGTTGRASRYDIRIATYHINGFNFYSTAKVFANITPAQFGFSQNILITGLASAVDYYFAIVSIDGIGNRSMLSNTVSTRTIAPDFIAPNVAITNPVSGSTHAVSNIILTAIYSDDSRGVNSSSVRVYLDQTDVTDLSQVFSSSCSFSASNLSNGSHQFSVSLMDNVNNFSAASATFAVDTLSPNIQIMLNPESPFKSGPVEVILNASEPLQECFLSFTIPSSTTAANIALTMESNMLWKGTLSAPNILSGIGNFSWSGKDLIGNTGNQITLGQTFSIDNIPPSATLTSTPQPPFTAGQVGFSMTTSESVRFISLLYSIDGQTQKIIPLTGSGSIWSGSLNLLPDFGYGKAEVSWVGIDNAGNSGTLLTGTTYFVFDTIPPVGNITINNDADVTNTSTVTVNFNAVEFTLGGRVAPSRSLISFDGINYVDELFVASKLVTFPAEGGLPLSDGSGSYREIFVKFRDALGNESVPIQDGIILTESQPARGAILLRKTK